SRSVSLSSTGFDRRPPAHDASLRRRPSSINALIPPNHLDLVPSGPEYVFAW
ncbi:unnamed protein product, partial [Musa banksii]